MFIFIKGKALFYELILFCKLLTSYFLPLFKFPSNFLDNWGSKFDSYIGPLWKEQTKKSKCRLFY